MNFYIIKTKQFICEIIRFVARRRSEDIPGSIHQYVTGVAEQSQHSHRPEDDAEKPTHLQREWPRGKRGKKKASTGLAK
ncbi:hypothetical protein TUM12151_29950 [Morganella morganii]|nr:hypothetical protein TUM12149_19410 [Morganella morganii]GIZ31869.1 hypothetical protein TUM12150_23550 [Morganella morganii]GIZ36009.1 hypothetical protein TUM12151_29950 [Morganella morganii]